jgi:hypothetical protein
MVPWKQSPLANLDVLPRSRSVATLGSIGARCISRTLRESEKLCRGPFGDYHIGLSSCQGSPSGLHHDGVRALAVDTMSRVTMTRHQMRFLCEMA